MAIFELGKKNSWDVVKGLSAKEVLGFLDDGTVSLKGKSDFVRIEKCVCGDDAVYVFVDVHPVSFMRVEYRLVFLCRECYSRMVLCGDEKTR